MGTDGALPTLAVLEILGIISHLTRSLTISLLEIFSKLFLEGARLPPLQDGISRRRAHGRGWQYGQYFTRNLSTCRHVSRQSSFYIGTSLQRLCNP